MSDSYDLQRFVAVQTGMFGEVCAELRAGRKSTHWMWFIFPQIQGLGSSTTAVRYAISSLKEAEAYLQHPVLGPRLVECTRLVLDVEGRGAHEIFGSPDDLKFHSSMTLFANVDLPANAVFHQALDKYFGGRQDSLTLARI